MGAGERSVRALGGLPSVPACRTGQKEPARRYGSRYTPWDCAALVPLPGDFPPESIPYFYASTVQYCTLK
jgi:hypothetical protein